MKHLCFISKLTSPKILTSHILRLEVPGAVQGEKMTAYFFWGFAALCVLGTHVSAAPSEAATKPVTVADATAVDKPAETAVEQHEAPAETAAEVHNSTAAGDKTANLPESEAELRDELIDTIAQKVVDSVSAERARLANVEGLTKSDKNKKLRAAAREAVKTDALPEVRKLAEIAEDKHDALKHVAAQISAGLRAQDADQPVVDGLDVRAIGSNVRAAAVKMLRSFLL